jgi:uncharacterized membrane protein
VYQLSVYLHILGAVVWVGGMLFLALVLVPALRPLPPAERAALVGAVGRRFRAVGWACIALLVVTGLVNAAYRGVTLETFFSSAFLASAFGRTLWVKLALVLAMIVLSAIHDFGLGPASTRAWERGDARRAMALRRQASWNARVTALLGLLVILLAVGLVRGLPL